MARSAMGACQWWGVAMTTASIEGVGQDLAEVAFQLGRMAGRILDRLTCLLQDRRVHVAEGHNVGIGPIGQAS